MKKRVKRSIEEQCAAKTLGSTLTRTDDRISLCDSCEFTFRRIEKEWNNAEGGDANSDGSKEDGEEYGREYGTLPVQQTQSLGDSWDSFIEDREAMDPLPEPAGNSED